VKKAFYIILFFGNILFIFAENTESENEADEIRYIFSLDTGITMTALQNYGFGIGINYEYKLTDFLSIKPGFGHMVCFSDIIVVTVDLQLFLNCYPLSNGLDKLYIGLGSGCDFFMYNNEDILQDTTISITPILGWKWKALKFLMIDPFIGWKFYILETNNYEKFNNYLNGGFQWGINLKIYLPNKND
jgi:hypothetical protein